MCWTSLTWFVFSCFSGTKPRFQPRPFPSPPPPCLNYFENWIYVEKLLYRSWGWYSGQFKPKRRLGVFCWEKVPHGNECLCCTGGRNSQLIQMLPSLPIPRLFLCNGDYINCLKFSSCLRNGSTMVILRKKKKKEQENLSSRAFIHLKFWKRKLRSKEWNW